MKKLLVFSAVLIGAVSASQAGVHLGFGIPLPPLPGITLRPPVIVTPPPICEAAPPIYYGYSYWDRWHPRYDRDDRGHFRRDWDRHDGHHDRDRHGDGHHR